MLTVYPGSSTTYRVKLLSIFLQNRKPQLTKFKNAKKERLFSIENTAKAKCLLGVIIQRPQFNILTKNSCYCIARKVGLSATDKRTSGQRTGGQVQVIGLDSRPYNPPMGH